jgi:hypothetical protein
MSTGDSAPKFTPAELANYIRRPLPVAEAAAFIAGFPEPAKPAREEATEAMPQTSQAPVATAGDPVQHFVTTGEVPADLAGRPRNVIRALLTQAAIEDQVWKIARARMHALLPLPQAGRADRQTAATSLPTEPPPPGTRPSGAEADTTAAHKPDAKGKRIDERMAKILLNNALSVDWTAHYWAEQLECSRSTVVECSTWEKIMTMRKLREAEKATKQKNYRPADPRRMGRKRSDRD